MKLKVLAAAGVLVGAMLAAAGIGQAANPVVGPGPQNHQFNVTYSTTASGAPVDITVLLTLGQQSTGQDTGFFHDATTQYTGITRPAKAGAGLKFGEVAGNIDFQIQTNVQGSPNISLITGQAPDCGAPGLAPIVNGNTIYVATTAASDAPVAPQPGHGPGAPTDVTSTKSNPAHVPYSYDQEANPAFGGVPYGVTHLPDWYTPVLSSLGIGDSLVQSRGFAIAVVIPGAAQTSVSFLTIGPISLPATAQSYQAVTVLGDPTGAFNPAAQTTATCPPFQSTVDTLGTTTAGSNWASCLDFQGAAVPSCTPYAGATGGTVSQSITTIAGTYPYAIALGQNPDLDNDAELSTWDPCPVDVGSADGNSNGVGDACDGLGESTYWTNSTVAATAGCGLGQAVTSPPFHVCQDADQDEALNGVDNCPLTPNATGNSWLEDGAGGSLDNQRDNDRDGVGNACDPQPNIPGDGNGYAPTTFLGLTSPTWLTGSTGKYKDWNDVCGQGFTVGGAVAAATCEVGASTDQGRIDTNNDGVPDFFSAGSGACINSWAGDSNGDGYSDGDHTNPGTAGCTRAYTAERNTDPLDINDGCFSDPSKARTDIVPNGGIDGIDLGALATFFTQPWLVNSDPKAAADINGNRTVDGLDLGFLATLFTQNVASICTNVKTAARADVAGTDQYTIGWDRLTGGPTHTVTLTCTGGSTTANGTMTVVGNSGKYVLSGIPQTTRDGAGSCDVKMDAVTITNFP